LIRWDYPYGTFAGLECGGRSFPNVQSGLLPCVYDGILSSLFFFKKFFHKHFLLQEYTGFSHFTIQLLHFYKQGVIGLIEKEWIFSALQQKES